MSSSVIITSGDFSAAIKTLGAELCSVKHLPTNTEFMWQASPVWPRHAPVLFPFVGRLRNFEYQYNGKKYAIEQHGFARDLLFSVVQASENKAIFELRENHYTLQRYPFLFAFRVIYELNGNMLTMGFEMTNMGNSTLPFSFGAHPAFQISEPGEVYLQFESDRNPMPWILQDNFISTKTRAVSDGKGTIEITKDTFLDDALKFKKLSSDWVKLISPKDNIELKLHLNGWPYLGIWAKPGASFVCIEPWHGLADAIDFDNEVNKKEGIIMLLSKDQFRREFSIEFNFYR